MSGWRGQWRRLRWGSLSLRSRLTLMAALAVAVAVVGVSAVAFLVVNAQLQHQLDEELWSDAQTVAQAPDQWDPRKNEQPGDPDHDHDHDVGPWVQELGADGRPLKADIQDDELPVSAADRAVAAGAHGGPDYRAYREIEIDHVDYRMVTVPVVAHGQPARAVQVALPTHDVERTLKRVGALLVALGAAGVAVAAALGWAVARAGLRPVDRLTGAVERVAVTGDLNSRIEVTGQHEIARLAGAFNGTLAALASSRAAQRLLVEDAGHELRTPLTSLRTNIELLIRAEARAGEGGRSLSAEDRARLMGDLETQLTELTALTNELVDLAREDLSPEPVERVDLAELVDATVQRARTRAPAVEFDTDLAPVAVPGRPASLERMVLNLLDNAAKWSPPGTPVRVGLRAVPGEPPEAELTVTDAGPGIADADLPRIFERFYRAVSARSMPGSGLGLAIVAQAVALHGGGVEVDRPAGGGARFTVRLPAILADS